MTSDRTIQTQYNRYQQVGFPGQLARPNAPHDFDRGQAEVALSPGQGVFYNSTENKWQLPTSTAERLLVTAVVGYDTGTVQNTITQPAGANSDQQIVFAADSVVKLQTEGSVYIVLGGTLEYGQTVVYNQTTGRWIAAPAIINDNITSLPKRVITLNSTGGADGDVVEVKLGSLVRP